MVEQRANLDYGATDTPLDDTEDLIVRTNDPGLIDDTMYTNVSHDTFEDDELAGEENPEASTYGAP
jgi:hypothetical protein